MPSFRDVAPRTEVDGLLRIRVTSQHTSPI